MKSVSVIVPTYNGANYIGEAIDSALAQTLIPLEIIVVDDGSTDATSRIVSRYGDKVRYLHQQNRGPAATYNAGIAEARGDYISFLEHDDFWHPEKNAEQVRCFEADNRLGMVFCPVALLRTGEPSKRHDVDFQERGGRYGFSEFFERNRVLNCSSVMLRRSALTDVDAFRAELPLAFDYDLWLRIAEKYSILCLDTALATYRIHGSNLSRDDHELMAAIGSLGAIQYWARSPFARKAVGRRRLQERLIGCHRRLAWDYSQLRQTEKEREHRLAALKVQPWQLRGWREYCWSLLSPSARQRVAWYVLRMRRIFRRAG